MPCVPCMPAWSTCPRANVSTSQKRANFSFLRANVSTNALKACQLFILACQRAKGMPIVQLGLPIFQRCTNLSTWHANVPIFQPHLPKCIPIFQLFLKGVFQFLNFSVMFNICIANFKNIWAILENLSRKTKNLNFDIFKI